jgi:hypothetical protein
MIMCKAFSWSSTQTWRPGSRKLVEGAMSPFTELHHNQSPPVAPRATVNKTAPSALFWVATLGSPSCRLQEPRGGRRGWRRKNLGFHPRSLREVTRGANKNLYASNLSIYIGNAHLIPGAYAPFIKETNFKVLKNQKKYPHAYLHI